MLKGYDDVLTSGKLRSIGSPHDYLALVTSLIADALSVATSTRTLGHYANDNPIASYALHHASML